MFCVLRRGETHLKAVLHIYMYIDIEIDRQIDRGGYIFFSLSSALMVRQKTTQQ